MSDGDPYKRQKISEDQEQVSSEDTNLMYQNTCLSTRLKEQRKQISDLSSANEQLSLKVKTLEETLLNFNCSWAKTISNLNTLCAELSVPPDKANPFDVFIQDSSGLEQLTEITKKCLFKLLETIEKVSEYESGAIVENCREEIQTNDIQSENMRLKFENKVNFEEIYRLREMVETLQIEKNNLAIRLIKKGDYKVDSSPTDKGNENIDEIKSQRDMFEKMLGEETRKNTRSKYQHEVSHERIVQSRAFKNLIHQAKALRKKLDNYRDKSDYLYQYKEKFKEKLRRECEAIMEKESNKRDALVDSLKEIQHKLVVLEREKNEANSALESLKTVNNEHKTTDHFKDIIDQLTSDKESLKSQNNRLKEKIAELSKKIEDYENINSNAPHEPEVTKLLRIIEDYKQKLKSEHCRSESLISEIEVTETAYEKLVEKLKSLALQLAEQENLYNKLMNEKVKESSWRTVHDQESKAYENKINSLEQLILSHEALHKEYEKQLKSKQDLLVAIENKSKELEGKVKNTAESSEESLMRYYEIVEYKKDYMSGLKRSEDFVANLSQEKQDLKIKLEKAHKEVHELNEKLKCEQDLDNVKSADDLLNKEVAYYRKMIRCSVCCSRVKSVILTKCLHTFCKECLDEYLASRKRKCPLCKNRFSQDDMKNFWWDR